MHPSFVSHLRCPLCTWATVASAPTYERAQRLVTALVLEHVTRLHATAGAADDMPPRALAPASSAAS